MLLCTVAEVPDVGSTDDDDGVLLVGTASVNVVVVWLVDAEVVEFDMSVELFGVGTEDVNVDEELDGVALGETEELEG
jgi:hypothetical protein